MNPNPTPSDSEAEELLIFGLIVHYLGLPENANPDKYNALTKKMVSLLSRAEIEGAIGELQALPEHLSDGRTINPLAPDHDNYIVKVFVVERRITELQAQLKAAEGEK